MLQVLKDTDALNDIFEQLLDMILNRTIQGGVVPVILKKHLIGAFMAAMCYNRRATMLYLE